jgi:hypothetical protein
MKLTRCCSLFAAVVHCLQAVPQRYSRNVHDAATAQALGLYADAAGGPTQQPCGHVASAILLYIMTKQ